MAGILSFLQGKKTYLVAIAWAVTEGLVLAGVIDPHTAEKVETWLLPLGLATLRNGIKK